MSRELKFRAWNAITKKMIDCTPAWWNEYWDEHSSDDWEIMQYTGLKDKNGKEIYEGDILQDSHENACKGEVRWLGYKWDCGTDEDIDNDQTPIITETKAIEVIGNIWESPELLKSINDVRS